MTRRSPAVIALLLVATACIDAVVIYDLRDFADSSTSQLLAGLVAGQLSVACLGASLVATSRAVQWALPLAAVAIGTLFFSMIVGPVHLPIIAIVHGLHAAFLMGLLWLMKRTAWWRRLSPDTAEPNWQFSLVDLLLAMTAGALLFTILGTVMTDVPSLSFGAILAAQSLAIALAGTCATVLSRSPLYRLAILLGVTLLVAAWPFPFGAPFYMVVGVTQAIVLFVWLELGAIIPPAESPRDNSQEGEAAAARLQDAAPTTDDGIG